MVMETALRATQSAGTRSDNDLVVAVRRGSDLAFEELYSRYRTRIGSYVFGMVGDHARAEDIAQEVFISALRRLRDTERPIAFKPWLYEIAKNACIDEFRRTRRKREVPLAGDDEDEGDSRNLAFSGGPTPDVAVENKQRLSDLRGAFRGLSESHHRIIVMREFEGLTYEQIGDRLGMSKAMVESTLFRARKRLGEEYEELVSGRRCEQIQGVITAGEQRPLRSLGIRDRRQLARHLAHCQPCRRCARMSGVDESFFHVPGVIGKIAALLPFPWLRWRRSRGPDDAAGTTSAHQLAALQTLQGVARFADPTAPSYGLGRATAAAAAIVVAGAGGGLVTGLGGHGGQFAQLRPLVRQHHASPAGAAAAASAPALKPVRASTGSSLSTHASGSARRQAGPGPAHNASQTTGSKLGASGPTSSSASSPTSGIGGALQQPQSTASSASKTVSSTVNSAGSTVNKIINGATGSSGSSGSSGSIPGVNLPPLPPNPLPQLPQPQLPQVTTPQIQTPTVPGVTTPDPSKLVPPLGQKSP
jgi:RNA polymerase sigma factor (sigma-70 family)